MYQEVIKELKKPAGGDSWLEFRKDFDTAGS